MFFFQGLQFAVQNPKFATRTSDHAWLALCLAYLAAADWLLHYLPQELPSTLAGNESRLFTCCQVGFLSTPADGNQPFLPDSERQDEYYVYFSLISLLSVLMLHIVYYQSYNEVYYQGKPKHHLH